MTDVSEGALLQPAISRHQTGLRNHLTEIGELGAFVKMATLERFYYLTCRYNYWANRILYEEVLWLFE